MQVAVSLPAFAGEVVAVQYDGGGSETSISTSATENERIVPRGRGGRQSMSSARTGQTMSPNLRQKNGRGRAKDTRVPRAARRSKSGSALAAVAARAAQLSVRVLTRVRRARHFKVPLSVRGGQGE